MNNMTATEVQMSWELWEARSQTSRKRWVKLNNKLMRGVRNRMLITLSNNITTI